jgi:hypothetical protein
MRMPMQSAKARKVLLTVWSKEILVNKPLGERLAVDGVVGRHRVEQVRPNWDGLAHVAAGRCAGGCACARAPRVCVCVCVCVCARAPYVSRGKCYSRVPHDPNERNANVGEDKDARVRQSGAFHDLLTSRRRREGTPGSAQSRESGCCTAGG